MSSATGNRPGSARPRAAVWLSPPRAAVHAPRAAAHAQGRCARLRGRSARPQAAAHAPRAAAATWWVATCLASASDPRHAYLNGPQRTPPGPLRPPPEDSLVPIPLLGSPSPFPSRCTRPCAACVLSSSPPPASVLRCTGLGHAAAPPLASLGLPIHASESGDVGLAREATGLKLWGL